MWVLYSFLDKSVHNESENKISSKNEEKRTNVGVPELGMAAEVWMFLRKAFSCGSVEKIN